MLGKNREFNWDRAGAMVVGILIALNPGRRFQLLDIPFQIPFVGNLLTGLLISRGANFIMTCSAP